MKLRGRSEGAPLSDGSRWGHHSLYMARHSSVPIPTFSIVNHRLGGETVTTE